MFDFLEDIIEALQTEPISVLVQNFSHQVDQHVGATTRCAYDSLEEIVEQWSKALQDSMFFSDCKGRLPEGTTLNVTTTSSKARSGAGARFPGPLLRPTRAISREAFRIALKS